MFIGIDLKPVASKEDWDRQAELAVMLLSNSGLTNTVTAALAVLEYGCATNYVTIGYATPPANSPFSPIYLANDFSLRTEESRRQKDEINFWNLLVATIPQTPYLPYPNETADILDVGCGQALGAISLHAYFGNSIYPKPGEGVTYTGIDIDENEIARAIIAHSERPDLHFAVADATDLSPIVSIMSHDVREDGFDVVVIRHQNASNPPGVWRSIFSEVWNRLRAGGILFVTSYTCLEHDIMLDDMLELGVTPWLNGHNPRAEMTLQSDDSSGLLKRDNYVAVFWKDFY